MSDLVAHYKGKSLRVEILPQHGWRDKILLSRMLMDAILHKEIGPEIEADVRAEAVALGIDYDKVMATHPVEVDI